MEKVYIAASRTIGERCKEWAKQNISEGFCLSDDINDCEIFISVMYDKLLDENFINSKKACFNFHPGILPEYRGSGSYSWVIINGEDFAGVTLHEIDVSIDHGNIIHIEKFPIKLDDTAGTLFDKAQDIIFSMFKNWFTRLLKGDYQSVPQNEDKAKIYYRKDLEKAKNLTRYIRALTFPGKEGAYYVSDGKKIYLT